LAEQVKPILPDPEKTAIFLHAVPEFGSGIERIIVPVKSSPVYGPLPIRLFN
jgi:hypothetical protein